MSAPAHLKSVALAQLRLVAPANGAPRAARLVDGVLQWLGDDLHPVDQIMLPEGEELTAFQPVDAARGWALDASGRRLHEMRIRDDGMADVASTVRIGAGVSLASDPHLGLVLVDAWSLHRLRHGPPTELALAQTIDASELHGAGRRRGAIHRVKPIDVGSGTPGQLALFDDQRHEITVMHRDGDAFVRLTSWPVFEDRSYPYAYDETPTVREPRAVTPLDIDGDGLLDLAMLCHDRLLLYLASEAANP